MLHLTFHFAIKMLCPLYGTFDNHGTILSLQNNNNNKTSRMRLSCARWCTFLMSFISITFFSQGKGRIGVWMNMTHWSPLRWTEQITDNMLQILIHLPAILQDPTGGDYKRETQYQ